MPKAKAALTHREAVARARRSQRFLNWDPDVTTGVTVLYKEAATLTAAMERHFTPAELAATWSLSVETVRRLFDAEPGVLCVVTRDTGRRRYKTLRIPESVATRVHRRMSA